MKLLMMEGNTLEKQALARKLKVRTATEIYIEAIKIWLPKIQVDVINAADGEKVPAGKHYTDYDGMVISGSGLRAFDQTPEVLNQLDVVNEFGQTGLPILGSCWGMQISALVAGGKVEASINGRELGLARKIQLTEAGKKHPFFAGKPTVFDAPCIHYDEVTELPADATLLCSNSHSEVQGAIIPVGKSEVWGVQYHPEFDLKQIAMLYKFYKDEMLEQNFVNNEAEYQALVDLLNRLVAKPDDKATAWLMGIDSDILNARIRALEINNWLKHVQG